jgi:hypothetical protein
MFGHPLNELLAVLRAAIHACEAQTSHRREVEASSRAHIESKSSVSSQSHTTSQMVAGAILTAARVASGM